MSETFDIDRTNEMILSLPTDWKMVIVVLNTSHRNYINYMIKMLRPDIVIRGDMFIYFDDDTSYKIQGLLKGQVFVDDTVWEQTQYNDRQLMALDRLREGIAVLHD